VVNKLVGGLGGLLALMVGVGAVYYFGQPGLQAVHGTVRTARGASSNAAPASAGAVGSTEAQAPAFHVTALNAGSVSVPSGRPTVVYFMSAGCGSCVSGEQQLVRMAAHAPASVVWLSLDVAPGYDTANAVLSMAQEVGAHWPQAFASNAILQAYHVDQLDMVAVIRRNGTLLYDGPLPSSARLRALIQQAEA